jgi:hypothetical protein
MSAMLRVPRSRGALSGSLLVLLGLWGAVMPLIGPYFHFAFTPDKAWSFTSGHVWFQIVPGAAVFLGGLIALASANRAFAAFGAWLAALGGAWYAVGVPVSGLWAAHSHTVLGPAVGGTSRRAAEELTLLFGLGTVVVFLAALALGRLAVVGVKDAMLAERAGRPADAPTEETTERVEIPRSRTGRSPVPASHLGGFTEPVPPTPPEPLQAPRTTTTGGGDVKVAGTPEGERPSAKA